MKLKRKNSVTEYLDYDYLDQLTEEEKAWFTQFNREYYYDSYYQTKQDSLHESVLGAKFTVPTAQHSNYQGQPISKKQDLNRANNQRRNDLYSHSRGRGALKQLGAEVVAESREDRSSIEYRAKVTEQSELVEELIKEAINEVEHSTGTAYKVGVLKQLIKDVQRVVTLVRKEKKKTRNGRRDQ